MIDKFPEKSEKIPPRSQYYPVISQKISVYRYCWIFICSKRGDKVHRHKNHYKKTQLKT